MEAAMKYLDHTLGIAKNLLSRKESTEAAIIGVFKEMDKKLAEFKYDVFLPMRGTQTGLEELVRLCYRLQGDPEADVQQLREKNAEYSESWLRRGGVGAWMMLARKFDRFEEQIKKYGSYSSAIGISSSESISDTVGDLRRYCLLILSFLAEQEKSRANQVEEIGAEIEKNFDKKLCVMCAHHRFTHENSADKCCATGCVCDKFVPKPELNQ